MKPLSHEVVFPKLKCDIEPQKAQIIKSGILPSLEGLPAEAATEVEMWYIHHLMVHGEYDKALLHIEKMKEKAPAPGLLKAWLWLATMSVLIEKDDKRQAVTAGEESLHELIALEDRSSTDYVAIVAGVLYNLAYVHYKTGENKRAEKELVKAQRLLEKITKKDNERFAPTLLAAIEASTDIFKSKLKQMNILAHYQVAADLYQDKVSSGVSEAMGSLVDSLRNEGDIHLKMGNYRDAVKYYTKALRYQKKINATMGKKELLISMNLGKALVNIINRHAAGEQLLRSLIPLAERLDAQDELKEINTQLENLNKSFDIMTFWKKLFVVAVVLATSLMANAQQIIGHRGSLWGVENTKAAFINGVKMGYEGLECDIRTTSDGTFVINHDANLKRLGADTTNIADMDVATVLNTPLNQTRGGKYYVGHLLTLGEYLDICKEYDKIPVVEIKECWNIYSDDENPTDYCYDGVPALMSLIKQKGMSDKVVIISFMAGVLDNIHKNYPGAHLQFLTWKDWRPYVKWCKERNMDIDIEYKKADAELVKTFHKMGLKVNVWTVDSPEVFKEMQAIGVDMITTNQLNK